MKKNIKNILVFLGVAAVILLAFLVRLMYVREDSVYVEIAVSGNHFGTYPLDQNSEIMINLPDGGYNIVKIQDHAVWVEEADCPGLDCVHQGKIRHCQETIICLPHQVIISMKGEQNTAYDAVVQ